MILLDTNVLGRMTDSADPRYAVARDVVHLLLARQEQIAIVPQNLFEFWAVATRKRGSAPSGENGLEMTAGRASQWMRFFQRRFRLLHDKKDLVILWHDLVSRLGVLGVRSHDARLVAAMQSYGITRLFTFNTVHFRLFPITLIDPGSI
jgi:predicted nucleic acid-binding protein